MLLFSFLPLSFTYPFYFLPSVILFCQFVDAYIVSTHTRFPRYIVNMSSTEASGYTPPPRRLSRDRGELESVAAKLGMTSPYGDAGPWQICVINAAVINDKRTVADLEGDARPVARIVADMHVDHVPLTNALAALLPVRLKAQSKIDTQKVGNDGIVPNLTHHHLMIRFHQLHPKDHRAQNNG